MTGGTDTDVDGIPDWVVWHEGTALADVDGDGQDEQVELSGGRVRVSRDGQAVFESPQAWRVSDVLVGDVDRTARRRYASDPENPAGLPEVIFLAWRRGNYGSSRPFWASVPADEVEPFSQHVFIYRWKGETLAPVWMSSALDGEVRGIGLDERRSRTLVRVQGADGAWTTWAWKSWGLERLPDEEAQVELLAAGDVIAHPGVLARAWDAEARAYDFTSVFSQVASHIAQADIASAVQESPLVGEDVRPSANPPFATPQAMGDALAQAGFSLVCGATNHANDAGPEAISHELAFWQEAHPEVELLGLHGGEEEAQQVSLVETGGVRVGLVDATYGLNGRNLPTDQAYLVDVLEGDGVEARLCGRVENARGESDLVVCYLHAGQEYESDPSDDLRRLACLAIDAGADAVICSHTHVLGPYGRITTPAGNRGVVFFGLGNFVANQLEEEATVLGGLARLLIEQGQGGEGAAIAGYALVPVVIHVDAELNTAPYLLSDYTDYLAAAHYLSVHGIAQLTCAGLRELADALAPRLEDGDA